MTSQRHSPAPKTPSRGKDAPPLPGAASEGSGRTKTPDKTSPCQRCGAETRRGRRGPDPKFCSDRCRKAAQRGPEFPTEIPAPTPITPNTLDPLAGGHRPWCAGLLRAMDDRAFPGGRDQWHRQRRKDTLGALRRTPSASASGLSLARLRRRARLPRSSTVAAETEDTERRSGEPRDDRRIEHGGTISAVRHISARYYPDGPCIRPATTEGVIHRTTTVTVVD